MNTNRVKLVKYLTSRNGILGLKFSSTTAVKPVSEYESRNILQLKDRNLIAGIFPDKKFVKQYCDI